MLKVQDQSMRALLDQYMAQEEMHSMEGRNGVNHLCKIARALGYKDVFQYGRLNSGAFLGDLFVFLEDNSGIIEAMIQWISKNGSTEWKEAIISKLNGEDDDGQ